MAQTTRAKTTIEWSKLTKLKTFFLYEKDTSVVTVMANIYDIKLHFVSLVILCYKCCNGTIRNTSFEDFIGNIAIATIKHPNSCFYAFIQALPYFLK